MTLFDSVTGRQLMAGNQEACWFVNLHERNWEDTVFAAWCKGGGRGIIIVKHDSR
jgi:hypothetical protein